MIVVRLSAYIPRNIPKNNTWNYPFTVIDEEGFVVKKQLAKWISSTTWLQLGIQKTRLLKRWGALC